MEVRRNEVVGLIGENGAGKSSLLKILTGIHQPDRGTIDVNGKPVDFRRPQDAAAAGIGVVHQEQSLFTNLSVAENIAMNGSQSKDQGIRYGFYRWRTLNREAAETLARVHAKVDPRAIVGDLSFVERQMVEIARALRVDEMVHPSPLVILDEPTSVLERGETEILEREIRDLKRIGSVIFVSHRLDEVLRICDRVVVMRSGEIVAERSTADVDEDELFRLMVGRNERAEIHPKEGAAEADPVLQVEGLGRTHAYRDVNISLTPGRTVAIRGHQRLGP
jgi:ribose transport system ATP-binding protein